MSPTQGRRLNTLVATKCTHHTFVGSEEKNMGQESGPLESSVDVSRHKATAAEKEGDESDDKEKEEEEEKITMLCLGHKMGKSAPQS